MLLAASLVAVRDSFGAANVALVLTLVVVLAAVLGGRIAGGVSGVVAALSFNFFFTRPYLTMRVNDWRDVATILLIVAIGLIVGEVSMLRSRRVSETKSYAAALRGLATVTARVAAGDTLAQLVDVIRDSLVDDLGVASVCFDLGASTQLPTLNRRGGFASTHLVHAGRGFALPDGGVAVPVAVDGMIRGHLIVQGRRGEAVSLDQRRTIVAMADQLAIRLRDHPAELSA